MRGDSHSQDGEDEHGAEGRKKKLTQIHREKVPLLFTRRPSEDVCGDHGLPKPSRPVTLHGLLNTHYNLAVLRKTKLQRVFERLHDHTHALGCQIKPKYPAYACRRSVSKMQGSAWRTYRASYLRR